VWLSHKLTQPLGATLITLSALGMLQSALAPTTVTMHWCTGRWCFDGGAGTDHLVLQLGMYFEISEHESSEASVALRQSQFYFFHPAQLVPMVRVASPKPTPDLEVYFRIHYILVFLAGASCLWLRRKHCEKHRRGFAPAVVRTSREGN
jgi:hypothetical protein